MKYNHMCTIAFEVISEHDGENLTREDLLEGLRQRLRDLEANGDEIIEAVGLPDDTYIMED